MPCTILDHFTIENKSLAFFCIWFIRHLWIPEYRLRIAPLLHFSGTTPQYGRMECPCILEPKV